MYIYQIENLVNGKKYVGQTKDPKKRKQHHFYQAFNENGNCYNYPLQCAIRKYGKENFQFSIIEECDENVVDERELFFIKKLNTFINNRRGYNQTLNTECALRDPDVITKRIESRGKKCALVNEQEEILETFPTYIEAGRKYLALEGKEFKSPTWVKDVCQGKLSSAKGYLFRDLDERGRVVKVQYKSKIKKVKGTSIDNPKDVVYYKNISEAARKEGVSRSSVSKCVNGSVKYSHVGRRKWERIED